MKQNSIFSYVKRNICSSEGVDGNERCSSNAKEAPPPKRTKFNSIDKVRKWDNVFEIRVHLPNDQILKVAATFKKCKYNRVVKYLAFLSSVITAYLLKSLITKYLIFLQVIRVY